jgi:hypothetical protein
LGTYWKLRHWRGWSTAIHGFGVELRFGERFSAPQQSTSAPGRHVRVISVLERTSRACIQPAHGSRVPCPRRSTDSRGGKDACENPQVMRPALPKSTPVMDFSRHGDHQRLGRVHRTSVGAWNHGGYTIFSLSHRRLRMKKFQRAATPRGIGLGRDGGLGLKSRAPSIRLAHNRGLHARWLWIRPARRFPRDDEDREVGNGSTSSWPGRGASGTGSIEAAGFAREGQRLERQAYMSMPPPHTTVGPRALGSGP